MNGDERTEAGRDPTPDRAVIGGSNESDGVGEKVRR